MANRQTIAKSKPRSRNSRRTRQPGFGERVKDSYHKARDMRNSRSNSRHDRMTRHAAIAGSADYFEPDSLNLPAFKRFLSWLMALALLPLCFVTVITLFQRVGHEQMLLTFWKSPEFFRFLIGAAITVSYLLFAKVTDALLLLYVLGHEMTHAMFVYLCGGRISDLRFSADGGYIMTNKSNILIALAPYFVPFWSIVAVALYGFVNFFMPSTYADEGLLVLLGATWCFHIIWTVWMIPKDQPDLKEHGTFFSLMIIILANLVLLTALLCVTQDYLTMKDFAWNWWNNILDLSEAFWNLLFF
ncbi:MAG: hypothetical protein QNL33_04065 [Akkermansiaceae bacterium]|jgi:hypothetical protein